MEVEHKNVAETFDYLFTCKLGVVVPITLQYILHLHLNTFSSLDLKVIESLRMLLQKYQQYREILM